MSRPSPVLWLGVACVLAGTLRPASAQDAKDGPLTLVAVLDSLVDTHPKLEQARAAVDVERGRALAASSAFEPMVEVDGSVMPSGYYEYLQAAVRVKQTLPVAGVKLQGGYRLGRGDIPPYYGERATRDGGELFAKISVPLLSGRTIDKHRAALRKATLEIAAQDAELAATWLTLQRDASVAYWKWVAAGQKQRMASELWGIVRERAARIDAQADSGALPRIVKVDNDRVLLARQSAVLAAQARFVKAQAKLSLYYRNRAWEPILAPLERVPTLAQVAAPESLGAVEELLAHALRERPELRKLATRQQQARIDLELADNRALPLLDLNASAARDLGPGPDNLGQSDLAIGLNLVIPIQRREARGKRQEARAKLAKLGAETRGMRDRIAAELRQAAQLVQLAQSRLELARERMVATARLAAAERQRFDEGASDVLVVNLRELDVAAAAADAIDAVQELHRAQAELFFARGGQ